MRGKQTVFCKMSGRGDKWRRLIVESSVSPLNCVNCTKITNPHTINPPTMDLNMAVPCNTGSSCLKRVIRAYRERFRYIFLNVLTAKPDSKTLKTKTIASSRL